MVAIIVPSERPITLARVAIFNGNLETAVQRFNPACARVTAGLGNTKKYALYHEGQRPYLLMVSQQINKEITVVQGSSYNSQLTVTSRYSDLNEEVAREFQTKTGIEFRESPAKLAEFMQNMGMSFSVFEMHGQKAMEVLRGL